MDPVELEEIRRRLAADPRDREAWAAVAPEVERTGVLPGFVTRAAHLEVLWALREEDPADPRPVALLGAFFGLRPAGSVAGASASFVRRSDGARMLAVPGGTRRYPRLGPEVGERSPLDVPPMDENASRVGDFVMDLAPITRGRYRAFLDSLEEVPPDLLPVEGDALGGDPQAAVRGVSWSAAVAYGEWAGARLPSWNELRMLGPTPEAVSGGPFEVLDSGLDAEWAHPRLDRDGGPLGWFRGTRVLLALPSLECQEVDPEEARRPREGCGFRLAIRIRPPPRVDHGPMPESPEEAEEEGPPP